VIFIDVKKKTALFVFLLFQILLSSCVQTAGLKPKQPITLTMWHNFGGQMQDSMNDLIEEFNTSIGKEKGIVISITSISGTASLQEKLTMIAADDPGSPEMPDIATCYPATAVLLADKGLIISMDQYFTDAELKDYLPQFLAEGRLPDKKLYVFPFAKSTEVLFLNKTLFERFSSDTGITIDDLATFEGIAETAMKYYEWTDEQTPGIQNDGKSFYTADSFFNLVQVGMVQLGSSLFYDGKLQLNNAEFQHIWNVIFEPAVKGGYAIYDGYSSDLAKTGDIICSTGSTAGILFYGNEITYPDNTKEKIEYVILPYPTFEGGEKVAIQRGSGLIVAKSTPQKEEAAALFLKWFTSPEQNMRFVSSTGYLPITHQAFTDYMEKGMAENTDINIKKLFPAALKVYNEFDFYIPPVFDEYNSIAENFESGFSVLAAQKRKQYLEYLKHYTAEQAYEKAANNALNDFIQQLR
jgi:multiple sugar transport system substrate-binding protein